MVNNLKLEFERTVRQLKLPSNCLASNRLIEDLDSRSLIIKFDRVVGKLNAFEVLGVIFGLKDSASIEVLEEG